MGEGNKDGGFVKNFVARLNANGGSSGSAAAKQTPPLRPSSSMARISATRTASVTGPASAMAHVQQSFRSREVGDNALPTVIKGTRGADGASMPLRPSAAQGVKEVDTTQFKPKRVSQTDAAVVEESSSAASARAFWEAKSRTGPSYTKKAGSQLQSFSQGTCATQSLPASHQSLRKTSIEEGQSRQPARRESVEERRRSIEEGQSWQPARRASVEERRRSIEEGQSKPWQPARRESVSDRVASLSKAFSQPVSEEAVRPRSPSVAEPVIEEPSPVTARAAAAPAETPAAAAPAKPTAVPAETTAEVPAEKPVEMPVEKPVVAEPEPAIANTPTTIIEVAGEENGENGENGDAAQSDDEPEVEDSSDGETAGGYSFGGADSDDDKDSDSDGGAGSYSFGGGNDSTAASDEEQEKKEEEETSTEKEETVQVAPSSTISVQTAPSNSNTPTDPAKAIWYKYTSGSEFAAPPIRRRRNVEGEMEIDEEENNRARYIGFNDVVTVFEDDLAGSQHHYTFMFNW